MYHPVIFSYLAKYPLVDLRHLAVSHVEAVSVSLAGAEASPGESVGAQRLKLDLNPLRVLGAGLKKDQ